MFVRYINVTNLNCWAIICCVVSVEILGSYSVRELVDVKSRNIESLSDEEVFNKIEK